MLNDLITLLSKIKDYASNVSSRSTTTPATLTSPQTATSGEKTGSSAV
jgi:hypothetical protein